MPDRPPVYVHSLPALIPPGALKGGVAVVVDVLRATTVMVHALAAGCEAVIPCLEIDEARRVANDLPPVHAVLGGERQGLPIEGFDLGNSPGDYTPEVCRGRTLVMTTTNGTRAVLASLEADRVLIGAFPNARATTQAAFFPERSERPPKPIHIVCSGTEGFISLEDCLLAGCLVSSLDSFGVEMANDEAIIARRAWLDAELGSGAGGRLEDILAEGRGGRRVTVIGLAADIRAAARVDRFDLVAELRRDPIRVVAARS
jgi:2-phosphosulfolactate phosphatase